MTADQTSRRTESNPSGHSALRRSVDETLGRYRGPDAPAGQRRLGTV